MKIRYIFGLLAATAAFTACRGDQNAKPTYRETGLPKNCRAIIQTNIDAYHAKQCAADEIMDSLERNCGANGYSW